MAAVVALTLVALLLFVPIIYLVGLYNSFVTLGRTVAQSFANLESVLKQRHDEISKLVNACQAYMEHERDLLTDITRLRARYTDARDPEDKIAIENELNQSLGRLGRAWEAYPDLKANQQFLQVHGRISGLETVINDRREQFNETVTNHNIFISQFPTLMLARFLGWREKPLLEISEADKTDDLAPFPVQAY